MMRLFHMALAAGVFSITSQQTNKTVTRNVEDIDVDTLEEICEIFISKDLTKAAAWTTEPVALDVTRNLYQWFIQERAMDEAYEKYEELMAEDTDEFYELEQRNHTGNNCEEIESGEWDAAFYNDMDYYPSRENIVL